MSTSPTEVNRRAVLRGLGLAVAVPLVEPLFGLPGYHPQVPSLEEDRRWQPRFLTSEEAIAVEELAECIIPETDTPGARGARVHQYIDWELSRNDRDRSAIREGLVWLDSRCVERHGQRFVQVGLTERVDVLETISTPESRESEVGKALFATAKRLTIRGYYRSAVGMHDELGYEGNRHLSRFDGCTHDEHLEWEP